MDDNVSELEERIEGIRRNRRDVEMGITLFATARMSVETAYRFAREEALIGQVGLVETTTFLDELISGLTQVRDQLNTIEAALIRSVVLARRDA